MDAWLSQVYGTGDNGGDLEKTAQHMMLSKLAEAEGIDLSDLSDEDLDALAQQVAGEGEGAGEGTVEEGGEEEGGEEELQAKFAEADFLGRVMAHSYTNELQKIAAEEGGAPFPPAKDEKCEDCGKKDCECESKEAAGPLGRAIHALGGSVDGGNGNVEAYVEKLAEARAEELAVGWLQANGYVE